jgi:hypothetical protein
VLYQIISEDPEPLLTLNAELPARLAAVIHRMLGKDVQRRFGSMGEVEADLRGVHAGVLRARARRPGAGDERLQARDYLDRARSNFDSGQFAKAQDEAQAALALEPELAEAVSLMWRTTKSLAQTRPPLPADPTTTSRIGSLLERAGSDLPEPEVRQALAELALIAPDDPRVMDLVRERSAARRH